jgi:hypothetical protein
MARSCALPKNILQGQQQKRRGRVIELDDVIEWK